MYKNPKFFTPQEKFPIGEEIFISEKPKEQESNLDPASFVIHNIGKRFFKPEAARFIYPNRLLSGGITKEEAFSSENIGASFEILPYFNSKEEKISTSKFMGVPYFFHYDGEGMQKWDIYCADGIKRTIIPEDIFCLRPNTFEFWEERERKNIVLIHPEESLPFAFMVFTKFYDFKTGEWNEVEKLRKLISDQYLASYGIYLEPKKIEVTGQGMQTRFLFKEKLPVDSVTVKRTETGMAFVPIINSANELCFYSSQAPNQSIFIPLSYLPEIARDEKIFLANGEIELTYNDILKENENVKNNLRRIKENSQNLPPLSRDAVNIAAYVAKTERTKQLAEKLRGKTREESVSKIMEFVNFALPYSSDYDEDKHTTNGPIEINMPPLVAFMNGGDDCEGHATTAASLIASLQSETDKEIGLCRIIYKPNGEGHIILFVPNLGTLVKDPFPNYFVFNEVPYSFLEATGSGDDCDKPMPLHQFSPGAKGYLPALAMIIDHSNQKIKVIGFNQFQY